MAGSSEIGKMVGFDIALTGITHFGGSSYHAFVTLRAAHFESFYLSMVVEADSFAEVPEKARLEVVRFAKELLERASVANCLKAPQR